MEITDAAKVVLHHISPGPTLVSIPRLVFGEGGNLGLVLDGERPGDEVVQHGGKKVLLISPELHRLLGDIVLDIKNEAGNASLVLLQKRPSS